jgi:hypothetical protein
MSQFEKLSTAALALLAIIYCWIFSITLGTSDNFKALAMAQMVSKLSEF